ncbi:MAG: type II toxin-antitoxin system VapC family toxin [Acidobacteria bacterium]|nr:type II toxin-antitoxin system VapC family toxin [Acidobacteriota bacterium]
MIVLDTDCLSLLERERLLESSKLLKALERHRSDEVCTTIITFEEQMRGWLSFIARCKNLEEQVAGYERLHRFLESYRNTPVLDFDEKAAAVFRELKNSKVRVGTMDLKIAAITIANEAILVTRNLSDFTQVHGLRSQDWT